ncbi:MAG: flavin oxidoreductase/NADH oxidase [Clostridia bacterium]|nr:flavin oxidoreductase/NADH oxidase [Clostridia bacterium]
MNAFDKKDSYTFSFTSPDQLRLYLEKNGYTIPFSKDISYLGEKVSIRTPNGGCRTLKNALATHPMEGCDAQTDGSPSELTRRRYARFSGSGAALVWGEAISVTPEGRTSDHQMMLTENNAPAFSRLVEDMKKNDVFVVAQLTHSGRFAKNSETPHALFATRSLPLESKRPQDLDVPTVTDDYLDSLPEKFAKAAKLAENAGFDAIDVKACHQYLLDELLSAHTREGKYGGSFENRSRLMLDCLDAVRAVLRPETVIASRLSFSDMIEYPYGFAVSEEKPTTPDLTETKKLLKILQDRGLSLVNMTMGSPYFNPHINRPYNRGSYEPPEHPLVGLERMIEASREIQAEFPDITLIGTGYSYMREFAPYIAAGALKEKAASMIGFGRMAFAYDTFAKDMIEGKTDPRKVCIACSKCAEIKRLSLHTGCPIRDQEIYLPIYREHCMKRKDASK